MTEQILLSNGNRFDVDDIYNGQNERVNATTHDEADMKGGKHRKTQFPTGVMVWARSLQLRCDSASDCWKWNH